MVNQRGSIRWPECIRAAWLASACAVLFPAALHAALPAATSDAWIEARSERFTVYSNAGEQAAVRAARHLERLADVLGRTTQGFRVDGGRDVRVFVFRDLESLKPYRPAGDDETGITAGFHASGSDIEMIAYHRPATGDAMTFASHEYLHAVVARSLGVLPVWINEGLAEFYSTFVAGRRSADIGRPIPEHVAWLREKGTLPLSSLMNLDASSRDYNEGDRRGTIYAQSWAMVHMMLMNGGADASRFSHLLSALSQGVPSRQAVRESYGPNALDSLESALTAYATRGTMPYSSWTFTTDFAEVPVRTRPLEHREVLVLLGELASRSKEALAPLANEHLDAAWREDSTTTLVAGLKCELADRVADDATFELWAAALERCRTPDPRATALAGSALATRPFRRGYRPSWPARGADVSALRARQLLESANEARPGRAEWLIPYGLTFAEDTADLPLGVEALMTAHEAAPRRNDAVAALALLQARAGARTNALTLYQSLPAAMGNDAAWHYWAGYAVARRTLDDAEKWFRAGRRSEAESLVVRLPDDVREAGVRAMSDQMLAWMRSDRRAPESPKQQFQGQMARARDDSGGRGRPPGGDRGDAGGTGSVGGGAREGGATGTGSDRAAESEAASAAKINSSVARAGAGDPRIARALSAARGGDYAAAEQMLEQVKRERHGRASAWLDTLTADVRNQRRMRSAQALLQAGDHAAGCSLYEQVLADLPKREVREFVNRQRAKYCRGGAVH